MASRFRQLLDSILFAGLKPNAPANASNRGNLLARIYARLERFLAGTAPSDPLYLSRRTWKQKLKMGLAVGIPAVVLLGAIAVSMSGLIPRTAKPPKEPSAAEAIARLLPDLEKTVDIQTDSNAEIVEVRVTQGSNPKVAGLLRNKSSLPISVEFAFELTDEVGSRLGAVTGRVDNAQPGNTTAFELPIKPTNAMFALVRELHTVR